MTRSTRRILIGDDDAFDPNLLGVAKARVKATYGDGPWALVDVMRNNAAAATVFVFEEVQR